MPRKKRGWEVTVKTFPTRLNRLYSHERCMMKNMIAKNIIAITLAAVGIISARTAEAATVTSGSYSTTTDFQIGNYSGPGFSANFLTSGGVFFFVPPPPATNIDFNSGTLPAGAPFDGVNSIGSGSTLTIAPNSCTG